MVGRGLIEGGLFKTLLMATVFGVMIAEPAFAQEGSTLTVLQTQISSAAKGWETTVMDAARSLFWILATIEIGIAAVWLALQAASLDTWFAEIVRRIMFIGFFLFVLTQGPSFAKAIVDSLFQIGAGGGTASPADVFNAGLSVASKMSEKVKFGVFEDNGLAIASIFAMIVTVIAFSLVAAIFVSVMVEMYVGLLAGMIMLGLGGSSYTKDFAVRYLVYAFAVGMKLMALVMIARIGSEVLIGLASEPEVGDEFQTALAIAGIAVVVFIVAIYVPNIMQGVVQGASVSGGMEAIRHGGQASSFLPARASCRRVRWPRASPPARLRGPGARLPPASHQRRDGRDWGRRPGDRLSRKGKGDRLSRGLCGFDPGAGERQARSETIQLVGGTIAS